MPSQEYPKSKKDGIKSKSRQRQILVFALALQTVEGICKEICRTVRVCFPHEYTISWKREPKQPKEDK